MADPNGCIEWRRSRTAEGYGCVRRDGRLWLAHRWVWTYIYGPIPDGRRLGHLCDNRLCVNVNHLSMDARAPTVDRRPRPTRSLSSRLWEHVDKTDDCWLWTGYVMSGSGHGQIHRGRRGEDAVRVHIAAYELLVGPVPPGKILHHRCEVKTCVNPDHLVPMTRAEHMKVHGVSRWMHRADRPPTG